MSTYLDTPPLTLVTTIARLGMRATRSHESGLAGINSTSTGELDRGELDSGSVYKSKVASWKVERGSSRRWKVGSQVIAISTGRKVLRIAPAVLRHCTDSGDCAFLKNQNG